MHMVWNILSRMQLTIFLIQINSGCFLLSFTSYVTITHLSLSWFLRTSPITSFLMSRWPGRVRSENNLVTDNKLIPRNKPALMTEGIHFWKKILFYWKDFRIFPPNEHSKEGFFLWGLYRKVGHGLLGGKVIKKNFFFEFFYYGGNIPFIYYLLTYLLFLPCILTHFIIFITDNELTVCRFEPKWTVWFGLCVVTDCLTNWANEEVM